MDTTTLPVFRPSTIAEGDTALLSTASSTGRHRRPSLLARVRHYTAGEPVVTAVLLVTGVLVAVFLVLAAVWPAPVSPGASWDPQPVTVAPVATVQCDSDASCAAYDYARGVQPAPVMDAGGVYTCPAGWEARVVETDTSGQEENDGHDVVCLPAGYADGTRWT
jgi:hypothetical protein